MDKGKDRPYHFSIQPFWTSAITQAKNEIRTRDLRLLDLSFCENRLSCIAGNGQLGLILDKDQDFRGYFYGVLEGNAKTPLYHMENTIFITFSPGAFSEIFHIPSQEVSAFGLPAEMILTNRQRNEIQQAVHQSDPLPNLLRILEEWKEQPNRRKDYWDNRLAKECVRLVLNSQGSIRGQELSDATGYTGRYLQDILKNQVGLTPKKLCKHIRFQQIIKLFENREIDNLPLVAQQFGYADQAHFSREFKEYSGLSPMEYQEMLLKLKIKD